MKYLYLDHGAAIEPVKLTFNTIFTITSVYRTYNCYNNFHVAYETDVEIIKW